MGAEREAVKEKAGLEAAGAEAGGREKALVEEGEKALRFAVGETRAAKGLALAAEGIGPVVGAPKLKPVLKGDCRDG